MTLDGRRDHARDITEGAFRRRRDGQRELPDLDDAAQFVAVGREDRQLTGAPPRSRVGDTRRMAMTVTAVAVERSGPAIRVALTEHAPEDCACFEAKLRTALACAADDLDLSVVETVLAR
jgi:hypothetical protein